MSMTLKRLPFELTICKVSDPACLDLSKDFYFIGRTDEELSLVCRTSEVPPETAARDDGWRCFRIEGVLLRHGLHPRESGRLRPRGGGAHERRIPRPVTLANEAEF